MKDNLVESGVEIALHRRGGSKMTGLKMQDPQTTRLKAVRRSNRHSPLNRTSARHLKLLVEAGEIAQLWEGQLYSLDLLEWGLTVTEAFRPPAWQEAMLDELYNLWWMTPQEVSRYFLWAVDSHEPTWIVERLQQSEDPMSGANELMEVVDFRIVEDYDRPTPDGSGWVPPKGVAFIGPSPPSE